MEVKFKKVETMGEFIDAIRLRVEVFIVEQGMKPGYEPDEEEKDATHFIAVLGGKVVGTAREREISPGEFKIERMATRKDMRAKGIAGGLLEFMLLEIKRQKPRKIWLRAQEQVRSFYEKKGFRAIAEPFDIYGKKHVDMEYMG